MSYAQPIDMEKRYPNRDLVQLTNDDATAQTVNTIFLQTFLSDASFEIDTFLASRYQLPLTDPPGVLAQFCCKIAMYHLQGLRPIHDLAYAKEQYEKTIAHLTLVKNGLETLGLSADGQEPADPSNPAVVQVNPGGDTTGFLPMRVFSRGSLIGF